MISPTITHETYSPTLTIHTLTVDGQTNLTHYAVCAKSFIDGRPDDAYLTARLLMSLMCEYQGDNNRLNPQPITCDLNEDQYRVITETCEWANTKIQNYQTTRAEEIAEFESFEGRAMTQAEIVEYALGGD